MDKKQLIAKYGKKFAATEKEAAPVLKGVHYAANGSIFVTNRLYGLRIKHAHGFPQAITIDAKTGAAIEGEYPQNFEKVFPTNHKDTIHLKAGPELNTAVNSALAIGGAASIYDKKLPIISILVEKSVASLSFQNDSCRASGFLGNVLPAETFNTWSLNADYLLTALQLFKDVDRRVSILLNRPMDPILLTDGEDIDVVIMPYRISK